MDDPARLGNRTVPFTVRGIGKILCQLTLAGWLFRPSALDTDLAGFNLLKLGRDIRVLCRV